MSLKLDELRAQPLERPCRHRHARQPSPDLLHELNLELDAPGTALAILQVFLHPDRFVRRELVVEEIVQTIRNLGAREVLNRNHGRSTSNHCGRSAAGRSGVPARPPPLRPKAREAGSVAGLDVPRPPRMGASFPRSPRFPASLRGATSWTSETVQDAQPPRP